LTSERSSIGRMTPVSGVVRRLPFGTRLATLGSSSLVVPALVVGLVGIVAVLTVTPWPVGAFEDDGIYTVLARSLATGEGFRLTNLPGSPNATHYPPGYPFVLSLLWRAVPHFPDNIVVFKFANAVFLALAALGTWYFARKRLAMSSVGAGIVAIVSTISVVVLFVAGLVLSEPLFLALLMPALLLAERSVDTGNPRAAAYAGLTLGALAMVRTLGALAIPAAIVVLAARRHFRAALILGATAALFIVPWQLWIAAHGESIAPVLMGKYGDYGRWLSDGYSAGGLPFLWSVVARNLQGLEGMLGYMLMPTRIEWARPLAFLTVVACSIVGAGSLVRRIPVTVMFFVVYVATILVWPFDANRFLWAVWPLVVITVWQCMQLVLQWKVERSLPRSLRAVALALLVAPLAGFVVYNARAYRGKWWASIQAEAGQQAKPIVEWVARNTNMTDVIATERDLMVHLYTGRRATPVSTFLPIQRLRPLSSDEDLEALLSILVTYEPRYVIVGAQQSVASAEALAAATPPELRHVGDLPQARIYERVRR
jgi:hypothetical protein